MSGSNMDTRVSMLGNRETMMQFLSLLFQRKGVNLFPKIVVMQMGWLNLRNVLSPGSGGWKSRIRVLAGLAALRAVCGVWQRGGSCSRPTDFDAVSSCVVATSSSACVSLCPCVWTPVLLG